jgi:hypothetical protein
MTISLKHAKTSAVADGGDTSLVQPSDWNAEHTLQQATNTILGRSTSGTGATEELTPAGVRSMINVEDGADVTDTANVTSAGALMDSELASVADVKALDQSVASGASPTFDAANITGILTGGINDAAVTFAKIQNFNQDRLMGRIDVGAGAPTALTPTSVRTMLNVEDGATADQTGSEILAALLPVDGAASGLDADLLDGNHASAFATSAQGTLADTASQPGDAVTTFDATAWRVFYSNGTGDVTELALGANGTLLQSNGASSAPSFVEHSHPAPVVLSADETAVNNSTTLVNTSLTLQAKAGLNKFKLIVFFDTQAAADIKLKLSFPAGTVTGTIYNALSANSALSVDFTAATEWAPTAGTSNRVFMLEGSFETDTAETVTLQYAQQTATVGDTVVKKFSSLEVSYPA